jgi:hypothetical protein
MVISNCRELREVVKYSAVKGSRTSVNEISVSPSSGLARNSIQTSADCWKCYLSPTLYRKTFWLRSNMPFSSVSVSPWTPEVLMLNAMLPLASRISRTRSRRSVAVDGPDRSEGEYLREKRALSGRYSRRIKSSARAISRFAGAGFGRSNSPRSIPAHPARAVANEVDSRRSHFIPCTQSHHCTLADYTICEAAYRVRQGDGRSAARRHHSSAESHDGYRLLEQWRCQIPASAPAVSINNIERTFASQGSLKSGTESGIGFHSK